MIIQGLEIKCWLEKMEKLWGNSSDIFLKKKNLKSPWGKSEGEASSDFRVQEFQRAEKMFSS